MTSMLHWDCRDCLHTPSRKCWRHNRDPHLDSMREGLRLVEPQYIGAFKSRLWNKETEAMLNDSSGKPSNEES